MTIYNDSSTSLLYLPENPKRFLYEYTNSKFYECNRALAQENINRSNGRYMQYMDHNMEIIKGLNQIKKIMDSFYIRYSLTAGTLLG